MSLHILHVPRATMASRHVPKRLFFTTTLSTPRNRFLATPLPHHHHHHHLRRHHHHHHHRLTKMHFHHKPPPPHQRASLPRFSSSPSFSSSSSSSPSRRSHKFGFVGWYLRMLEAYPLVTKSITSSLVFAAADFTSQMITLPHFPASYDLIRTSRMAVYGLLILGPVQHKWFNFLSKILPKTDVLATLKKILMGQVIFGPIINTVFFSFNGVLQGETAPEIIARLRRDLLPTLLGGALFWPVCDFVTFRFVPVHLQPLLNSACAYVWTIYLTYMANQPSVSDG